MVNRVLYYLTKANQHTDKLRAGKANKYRFNRLMAYKKAIYRRQTSETTQF